MTGSTPEQALEALGLVLPEPFPPAASYVAVRVDGSVAHVSGHGPMRDGQAVFTGRLGAGLDVATGQQAAELTMLNVLASLKAELGELSRVTGFLKLLVLVNAAPEFQLHHLVANGASDLVLRLYGPAAVHARSAIGVASLPMGIATEIEAVVRID
ncbi:RidA family protein [Pseudonocardia sp. GCM10023141]|uniref:RidA family protein n=1 Tax=Pseudonocardia sp. GCM10023141 TaxID=3252653 RepID=UPI00361E5D96